MLSAAAAVLQAWRRAPNKLSPGELASLSRLQPGVFQVFVRTPLYVCIVRRTGVTGRFSQQRPKECILFPQDMIIMSAPRRQKDGNRRKPSVLSPGLLILTAILLTCLYRLQVHLQSFVLKIQQFFFFRSSLHQHESAV